MLFYVSLKMLIEHKHSKQIFNFRIIEVGSNVYEIHNRKSIAISVLICRILEIYTAKD